MNKLNERLTLIANLSVVVGIVFLAAEMRQNTQAIQAQTRDSITEKQMEYYGWLATTPDLAELYERGNDRGIEEFPMASSYRFLVLGLLREFENSHYQYERGLFTPGEFEARVNTWRRVIGFAGAAPNLGDRA